MTESGNSTHDVRERPKLTPALLERVEAAARGEVLDVVLELPARDPASRTEAASVDPVASVRQGFERDALPVEDAIRSAGGTVEGKAWINQTIRAIVPVEALARLAELKEVVTLDVPRALRPE